MAWNPASRLSCPFVPMLQRIIVAPQLCAGSPTNASIQSGATVPPPTPNNPTVQNRSQFDYYPSQLHPRNRVSLEDNQAPQRYSDLSTTTSILTGAIGPLLTPDKLAVQHQNQFRDCSSQLFPYDRVSSDDSQTLQHYVGLSTSGSILVDTIGPPPIANRVALFSYDQVSSEDNQVPQHGAGPPVSVSASAGAIKPPHTVNNATIQNQNQFASCPPRPCLYIRNGHLCGEPIMCGTVPGHFSAMHSIKGPRSVKIVCQWQSCGSEVQRHNFVRHIREKHLEHKRG
ncbi:hypothetical protein EDC04DRAFT_2005521 [Pisolithus marmoratus]|nr:hypothetical protein EDC04DRAFT_2005521 [Pisolithus marmoratus]